MFRKIIFRYTAIVLLYMLLIFLDENILDSESKLIDFLTQNYPSSVVQSYMESQKKWWWVSYAITPVLIEKKGLKKDEAIFNVLREYIKDCKKIIFEGDGYSDDWAKEAKKRGLNNLKTTPEALKAELNQKFIDLYEELGIYSQREFEARNEIKLEKYCTVIDIEARVLADVARNHIIPAALNYQNRLIENAKGLKEIFGDKEFKSLASEQLNLIVQISENISIIKLNVDKLLDEKAAAKAIKNHQKQAEAYCNKVKPLFEVIRNASDSLEMMVDDELWPMTKYRELLFTR